MNRQVTATGLTVKARAEGGIVIARNNHDRDDNLTTDAATMTNALALLPTSTANATTWFHASGVSDTNGAAAANTMATLTLSNTAPDDGDPGIMALTSNADSKYVLYDTYTVYPDNNSDHFTDLWVAACYIDGTAAKNLSKSLRVAYVTSEAVIICAPVSGATLTYTVGTNPDGTTAAGTSVTAINTSSTGTTKLAKAANNTLKTGDVSAAGIVVNCYVYFEGEDAAHNTQNLNVPGIEDLEIVSMFECTSISASNS